MWKILGVEWELLSGLSAEDTRLALSRGRRRRFKRGQILFHEGDPGGSVHLVDRGRVAVRVTTLRGEVATLDVIVPGGAIGELALLLPGAARSATAVALEPTETLSIAEADFTDMRREHPALVDVLVQLLVARVLRLTDRLVEALYVPADTRVLRRILELAESYGDVVPLTQEDLAGLAGTTRGTVNRVLRREEQRGLVELGRGRLKVVDRSALARRAR